MKSVVTTLLGVVALLGPVILVLVAIGTPKDVRRAAFWIDPLN